MCECERREFPDIIAQDVRRKRLVSATYAEKNNRRARLRPAAPFKGALNRGDEAVACNYAEPPVRIEATAADGKIKKVKE